MRALGALQEMPDIRVQEDWRIVHVGMDSTVAQEIRMCHPALTAVTTGHNARMMTADYDDFVEN